MKKSHHTLIAIVIVIVIAFTVGGLIAPAQAQSRDDIISISAEKKKPVKQRAVRRQSGGHQIACTVFGCRPIPRNCYPTQGYTWDGMPTGFDIVVCR